MAPNIKFITNYGDIVIDLNQEKAPKTAANFIKYVESGHYTQSLFHRVIDGFMVQGGGFDENMNQKDAPHTVENEADNGLKNKKGTVAMARTNDPHSAGAQFFINVSDNSFLDHTSKTAQGWGYTVFGEVASGMDVVTKITQVKTTSHGLHKDVPAEPVIITEAVLLKTEEKE